MLSRRGRRRAMLTRRRTRRTAERASSPRPSTRASTPRAEPLAEPRPSTRPPTGVFGAARAHARASRYSVSRLNAPPPPPLSCCLLQAPPISAITSLSHLDPLSSPSPLPPLSQLVPDGNATETELSSSASSSAVSSPALTPHQGLTPPFGKGRRGSQGLRLRMPHSLRRAESGSSSDGKSFSPTTMAES